jgi:hypothetical protein
VSDFLAAGLVVAGQVIPGTSFVLRDSRAWWMPRERGTRLRAGPVSLLVGHWTAGRPHVGPDAARRVVAAMKARKRDDGSPLDVGIHFVVSADGLVFQTADLATATVHVGSRDINRRGIGVECCWPGTLTQALRFGLAAREVRRRVAGSSIDMMEPPERMVAAWVQLADALASLPPSSGVAIPRQVPGDGTGLRSTRLSVSQARKWRGAMEHFQVPGTTKIDAGTLLLESLARSGWRTESA